MNKYTFKSLSLSLTLSIYLSIYYLPIDLAIYLSIYIHIYIHSLFFVSDICIYIWTLLVWSSLDRPEVYGAFGIHPLNAEQYTEEVEESICLGFRI